MPKKYAKHGRNKRKPNGPAHPSLKRATVRNHGQEKNQANRQTHQDTPASEERHHQSSTHTAADTLA
jgi:hypothetical protein